MTDPRDPNAVVEAANGRQRSVAARARGRAWHTLPAFGKAGSRFPVWDAGDCGPGVGTIL